MHPHQLHPSNHLKAGFFEVRISNWKTGPVCRRITDPFLKLALKYGLIGPWSERNRSVLFDCYALGRGAGAEGPNLADLCVTLLMDSYVEQKNVYAVEEWFRVRANAADLALLASSFQSCQGLEDAPDDTVDMLALIADRMIHDQENLPEIRLAKVFKWLSAWAPAHVPMFDGHVHEVLAGYYPKGHHVEPSGILLRRMRALLLDHLDVLRELGRRFHAAMNGRLPKPLSPLRILDNLLWFDSSEYWKKDFKEYFVNPHPHDCFIASDVGREFLQANGF